MFDDAVRAVCQKAGWKMPPAENGVHSFSLEGGLAFTLSSPDGTRLMARAVLVPSAPAGAPAGPEFFRDVPEAVLRISAARFAKRKAVPYVDADSGDLALFAVTPLEDPPAEGIIRFVEAFLNDLSFWKAQPALTAQDAPPESPKHYWPSRW